MPVASRLVDYTAERFRMLCDAAGFGQHTAGALASYRKLLAPWTHLPVRRASSWVSDISDDNTPLEFSVAIADAHAEVRVLFEPQGEEPTIGSFREAGLAFNERLEREFGADLERFRAVQSVFLPEEMQGPFAVWSSFVFAPGHAPAFKAYFNPQAYGPDYSEKLVKDGLDRLGLSSVWPELARTVLWRGPELDELKYFALDLNANDEARVKVYVRHHSATPEDLEYACSGAENYVPREGLEFARAMRGGNDRLQARAAFTCSSFVGGQGERPAATTLYVPVCAYGRDDAVVKGRVRDYLAQQGADPSHYERIVDGFANRPLEDGVGMQPWTAFRRYKGSARLTVYLATEANRVHAPGEIPAPTGDRSAALSSVRPPPLLPEGR